MAHPRSLVPGAIFFLVHYYDEDLLVPDIKTLEYQRREVDEDGKDIWLFREPGGLGESASSEMVLTAVYEPQLYQLLNIDELLRVVTELRHVIRGTLVRSAETEAQLAVDRAVLTERVAEFLCSTARSLHISVRYADNGFFVQRDSGEIRLQFFMYPLLEPEQNDRLDQFMRTRGLRSREDYLADKGRTRIISMAVAEDEIVDLCAEVLSSVLRIHAADELMFATKE